MSEPRNSAGRILGRTLMARILTNMGLHTNSIYRIMEIYYTYLKQYNLIIYTLIYTFILHLKDFITLMIFFQRT